MASKTGIINTYFAPRLAQLNIPLKMAVNNRYDLTEGKRIPLQWIKTSSALNIDICKFTILLWPGNSYAYFKWRAFYQKICKTFIHCHCFDLAGKAIGQLRKLLPDKPMCIVVRPDGYILKFYQIDNYSCDQTINYLKVIFSSKLT